MQLDTDVVIWLVDIHQEVAESMTASPMLCKKVQQLGI